nr:hypothetical protein [Tanacetum cinerariifolium]
GDRYIFQRRTSIPTGSSGHDESSSLYGELGLIDGEEESEEDVPGADAGADNDKATAETKAESMVSVTIQQDMSSIPPMTTPLIDLTLRPESPKVHQLLKATTTETTTTTTTTTILPPPSQQQKSTTDAMMMKHHIQLYKALEKSMNRDQSEELAKDLAEVRKKKKKSRESPKTPLGSPPH